MPSLCRAYVLAVCCGTYHWYRLLAVMFPFMAHNSHNHDVINPRLCNDHCLVAISLHDIAFYIFGAVDNYPL